jgi:predicted amidohydrolase YtcJ
VYDAAELRAADLPADAEAIDLGGAYLIPGFVDTHFHLTSLALKKLRCDLSATASMDELYATLADFAAKTDSPFVMGVDWDESRWLTADFPTRERLDTIDDERPVLARRICGHTGVANTPLLERLTPRPDLIDLATGVVSEHALWQAGSLCAPPGEAVVPAIEQGIRALHRLGVTAIHDIVEPARVDPYLGGVAASKVPLRIDVLLHAQPGEIDRYVKRFDESATANVRLVGIKCFLDGSLGGYTAAVNEPYEAVGGHGTLMIETDDLRTLAKACHERGLLCAMHAIGDRAIDQALDVLGGFPGDANCFRIEHCEITGPGQLDRLRTAPVFLAMQPNFVRQWGALDGGYVKRLGRQRHRHSNRYATFRDAGIDFVFGSDGMPPGPLYGFKGATEHPIEAERLTPAETLCRYTELANAVGPRPREAGVIEPGRLADLTVLDGNILEDDVDTLKVLWTFVGGEAVFDRKQDG